MTAQTRWLRGELYRNSGLINPGENYYFTAGGKICVETWALDWGQHVFDYEVNSRGTRNGNPGPIATTRRALQNEFLERRVVTRQPVPVSVGDSNGNWIPEVAMTMGEVAPQIYTSRSTGSPLAWSISFRGHRSVAAGGTLSAGRNAVRRNPSAREVARGSAQMNAIPTGYNYLVLWVPVADLSAFRVFESGFGVADFVGTDPTLWERWMAWVTGR